MQLRPSFRAWSVVLCLAPLAFLVGCGGGPGPRAVVKGKVTIGGKNLTTGNVVFYAKDNRTASAAIDENGEYAINDAPVGEVKITVSVPKPPPGGYQKMMGAAGMKGMKDAKSVDPESGKTISIMGSMPQNVVPIPAKYADVDSSGLTYTVQSGSQTK